MRFRPATLNPREQTNYGDLRVLDTGRSIIAPQREFPQRVIVRIWKSTGVVPYVVFGKDDVNAGSLGVQGYAIDTDGDTAEFHLPAGQALYAIVGADAPGATARVSFSASRRYDVVSDDDR